jgi:hypothetical protein
MLCCWVSGFNSFKNFSAFVFKVQQSKQDGLEVLGPEVEAVTSKCTTHLITAAHPRILDSLVIPL